MNPDAPCNCVPEKIRLLISDVDGTLITPEKTLTARTCEAVNRLYEAGIAMAITSSRPPRGMRMLVESLRLTTPLAAYNGGLYARPDMSVIDQLCLSADVAAAVLRIIESHGLSVWVFAVATGLCAIATARMSSAKNMRCNFRRPRLPILPTCLATW